MCDRAPLLLARSWAAVGVANIDTSISADRTRIIFIVRFLDCRPRATGGPLNSRLDHAWTLPVERLESDLDIPEHANAGILQTVAVTAIGRVHGRASHLVSAGPAHDFLHTV